MAVDSMQKRYFGFAKIRCQKCTWTYTFDDTFASLKGYSQPSFFTLFSSIPLFRCFFSPLNPCPYEKTSYFAVISQDFFHADALDLESSIVAYNKKNTYNYRYA